jgi:hypothetical protein
MAGAAKRATCWLALAVLRLRLWTLNKNGYEIELVVFVCGPYYIIMQARKRQILS